MQILNIALTGHRPTKLGGYDINTAEYRALQTDFEKYISWQLSEHPDADIHCHSGLALGADTIWSKAILNIRQTHPSGNRVKFHAHVPSMQQASRWFKKADTDFWQEQIDSTDDVHVYAEGKLDSSAHKKSLFDRNIGMVEACDILLAVYDGSKSGTEHAINIARKHGKSVVYIHPKHYFK